MNQSVNYSPPAAISQYTGKDFSSSVSINGGFMQCSVLVRWMSSFKHLERQIYSCRSLGSSLCRFRQEIFSSMPQSFTLGPVVSKENNAIHWINLGKFLDRESPPEVQPLAFLYTIFHEKGTPFVYFLLTKKELFIAFNCCKCTVFWTGINCNKRTFIKRQNSSVSPFGPFHRPKW